MIYKLRKLTKHLSKLNIDKNVIISLNSLIKTSNKKVLVLIHPDCFSEKMLGKPDLSSFINYVDKIKNTIASAQYEIIITELFYSDFHTIDNEDLNNLYLEFRAYLKESTITFFRFETKFTSLSQNKYFEILEEYYKDGYTFCISGGYKEICLKNAKDVFDYVFGFIPEEIDDLTFSR